jgi:predicted glycogen debranching enzyme
MSVADRAAAPPIVISGEICRDFERSSRLEWLDTNHTGAFAMGTVAGVNTRRYHAHFIASLHPPAARYSILPRVEELLFVGGSAYELATVQYPGTVEPRGFALLDQFRIDPFPIWRYQVAGAVVEKSICLLERQQTALIHYSAEQPCKLAVRLFVSFRDYHSLTRRNPALRNEPSVVNGQITLAPYSGLPPLSIFHSGKFEAAPDWYYNHEYLRELERGLDFREDLFSPGWLIFELTPEEPAWFLATLEPARYAAAPDSRQIATILQSEIHRRHFERGTEFAAELARALDQFRAFRFDGRPELMAGYPWFTSWSRDTLVALPGLLALDFPTGEAKELLQMLADSRSQGLLPNRFRDDAAPEYNTADASLWFFVAGHALMQRTHDRAFLQSVLFPAAEDILGWHFRGTHFRTSIDAADQLLRAGTPETQLTWMDARVSGAPVTSRYGKPVEINALWYNALRIAAEWASALGRSDRSAAYGDAAAAVLASFRKKFWNSKLGCLYDVVRPAEQEERIRPNQLFALSLPFPLLEGEPARQVLETVQKKLLTPVGIRTLAPEDPCYRSRFEGSLAERDAAYHQGTAWPWLMGPFVSAYLYVHGYSVEAKRFCHELLQRFEQELTACCLGSLAEVYDAEAPQRPQGCPAQLWSVAEIARAWEQTAAS